MDGLGYIKRGLMFYICFSLFSFLPNAMEDSKIIVCKFGPKLWEKFSCVFTSLH